MAWPTRMLKAGLASARGTSPCDSDYSTRPRSLSGTGPIVQLWQERGPSSANLKSVAAKRVKRLTLPEPETFSEDEQLFAQVAVGIVRAGGAMFHGRYVEAVVARALGADFPTTGISSWDLVAKDGTKIEVRPAGPARAFSSRGLKDVDVWVFATWEGELPDRQYRFHVLGSKEVAKLADRSRSIRPKVLDELFPPTDVGGLKSAVRRAARRNN